MFPLQVVELMLSTLNQYTEGFQTQIELFDGLPTNSTPLATTLTSSLTHRVTTPATYYVVVSGAARFAPRLLDVRKLSP